MVNKKGHSIAIFVVYLITHFIVLHFQVMALIKPDWLF